MISSGVKPFSLATVPLFVSGALGGWGLTGGADNRYEQLILFKLYDTMESD